MQQGCLIADLGMTLGFPGLRFVPGMQILFFNPHPDDRPQIQRELIGILDGNHVKWGLVPNLKTKRLMLSMTLSSST